MPLVKLKSLTEAQLVELDTFIDKAEKNAKRMSREMARNFRKAMDMARVSPLAKAFRQELVESVYTGAGGGTWPTAQDAALDAQLYAVGEYDSDTTEVFD